MGRFVLGVSGASGSILALRLLRVLTRGGHLVDFIMTKSGGYSAQYELGKRFSRAEGWLQELNEDERSLVKVHAHGDVGTRVGSGSYFHDGMIVCPCSMASIAAIAVGLGDSCLRRAADVTLKEKRPLILVPREAPFSEIHLENLLKLSRVGATILPPAPAWYTNPKSLEDVENFIVGKVLDLLQVPHSLYPTWDPSKKGS